MGEDLLAMLDAVVDEESFTRFLQALSSDRVQSVEIERTQPSSPYGPDANGWENTTIEDFLESASAWAEDSRKGMSPLSRYKLPENPWKRCADIIFAGKFYE